MIFIDPRNPKPLHEQIKESVLEQISLGVLTPGDRLPSVRDMAQSMRIAPNTIQRAYRDLETGGVISSYPGRGSFITIHGDGIRKRRREDLVIKFIQMINELRSLGVTDDEMTEMMKGGAGQIDQQ
jgi:GntR family transcriptional regulator